MAVIWFNRKEALSFLLTNGFVYTLRKNRKENGEVTIMTSIGGRRKVGRGIIRLISENGDKEEEIAHLAPFSGFKSVEEWMKAAEPGSRYLYRVDVLRLEV